MNCLQGVDCRLFIAKIFKRLGLEASLGESGSGSRLPVDPSPVSRGGLYFYCNESGGVNVFLFFTGMLFQGNGLRVLGGGLGVDMGSLAGNL